MDLEETSVRIVNSILDVIREAGPKMVVDSLTSVVIPTIEGEANHYSQLERDEFIQRMMDTLASQRAIANGQRN